MLNKNIHLTTPVCTKELAKQLKNEKGVKHLDALELAPQSADFLSFRNAQKKLSSAGKGTPTLYVLLTILWRDRDCRTEFGRETLRIELSVPILTLCDEIALKEVRGFGNLRMVAGDHFVCDDIVHNQAFARDRLCLAEQSLRFMEYTDLRPCSNRQSYLKALERDRLPNMDHCTYWVDQVSGQFVLVDEPYRRAVDAKKRADWSIRTGWRLQKTNHAGMYNPYNCDLYVSVDGGSSYDFESLIEKIHSMPKPRVSNDWHGESVNSWEPFMSPMQSAT